MTIGYQSGDGKIEIKTNFECPSNCHSCTAADKCTKCLGNYLVSEDQAMCVTFCSEGFYAKDGKCQKCSSSCCNLTNDASMCSSCKAGFSLHGSECIKVCTLGTGFIYRKIQAFQGAGCANCDGDW